MPVIPVSIALIDTIRYGALLTEARLTVYSGGNPTVYTVPMSVGSITVDRNSAQRRSGTVTCELLPTIPPQAVMPINPQSQLSPFANEVFLEYGVFQANKPIIWIPLGLYAIADSAVADTTNDVVVTLTLYDRSWTISQHALLHPYNVPATASGNFVDEVKALLDMQWAVTAPLNRPLTYNIVPTSKTVPAASYNQGADAWAAAQDMATAVGYELFFDINGVVTGLPVPDPSQTPVTWSFLDDATLILGAGSGAGSSALLGSPYSTPAAVTNTMTHQDIPNHIIVTGTGSANATGAASGSAAPVLAEAADLNPASPTYIHGRVGDVPQFISSNLVTTTTQAQEAADTALQVALSKAWQVSIDAPPSPIYDIDDVIIVDRPRVGLNNTRVVIDTINYSVSYGDLMRLSGRVVT